MQCVDGGRDMPTQALRGNVQKIQASDTYETHGNTGEGDTRMTENTQPKKTVTRRQVLAMAGCGVGGLVVGGVLMALLIYIKNREEIE